MKAKKLVLNKEQLKAVRSNGIKKSELKLGMIFMNEHSRDVVIPAQRKLK